MPAGYEKNVNVPKIWPPHQVPWQEAQIYERIEMYSYVIIELQLLHSQEGSE